MDEKISIFILYIVLIQIYIFKCSTIIVFDSHKYRSGHFAFNSNKDMIIEYSNDNYRLFYGLKANGKYYFNNNSSFQETTITENGEAKRYEAKNIFVEIDNKEYLLSIASSTSVIELWDLNGGEIVDKKFKLTSDFLGNQEYSYVFSLLDINTTPKNYIISYIKQNSQFYYNLQKFNFDIFGLDNSNFQLTTTNEMYKIDFSNRIVSCFIMNEKIVVFLVGYQKKYYLYIYNFNLEPLNKDKLPEIDYTTNFNDGIGLFSKAYHIENNDAIFIYFTQPNSKLLKLNIGTISDDSQTFSSKIYKTLNYNHNLNYNTLMNDFIKISPDRFIYLGLNMTYNKEMYIYLFDLYNNYQSMNIRIYRETFNNDHQLCKDLSADVYNNLLIFTATATKNSSEYSILMIFGYANYTDNIIDISEYFMDDDINNSNNLVDKLLENINIENNIFNYYIDTNEIKLISIPEEILFYNGNSPSNENKVSNGENLNRIYTFKQKLDEEKSDAFYFIDYQPIIKEPNSDNYNLGTIQTEKVNEQIYRYEQRTYYGRTITVKFKLCHRYCGTCLKYGKSDNIQLCESCLPQYSFFYGNEFNSNCIPNGYFYDKDDNI